MTQNLVTPLQGLWYYVLSAPHNAMSQRGDVRGAAFPQMRRIDLEEYVATYKALARRAWLEAESARLERPRSVRRRPRSEEEAKILTLLARARLRRALATGELTMIGPRRYRLRVFDQPRDRTPAGTSTEGG